MFLENLYLRCIGLEHFSSKSFKLSLSESDLMSYCEISRWDNAGISEIEDISILDLSQLL